MDRLYAMDAFVRIVDGGSLTAAANALDVSQPSMVRTLAALERALGVRLLNRTTRRMSLTDEGRDYYARARQILSAVEDAQQSLRARNVLPRGRLRIASSVSFGRTFVAPVVVEYLAAHPEVKLSLSTCAVEWEFDDVHTDVGLVYCQTPPDPKFHWVPLFEYSLFPVCSPAMAARMGEVRTPADLLDQPLVAIYTEVQNWETWFEKAGLSFDPASPYLVVDTLAVALEMALDDQAVALVNGPFVDSDLASGRLVRPVNHKVVCSGVWGLICR